MDSEMIWGILKFSEDGSQNFRAKMARYPDMSLMITNT